MHILVCFLLGCLTMVANFVLAETIRLLFPKSKYNWDNLLQSIAVVLLAAIFFYTHVTIH